LSHFMLKNRIADVGIGSNSIDFKISHLFSFLKYEIPFFANSCKII